MPLRAWASALVTPSACSQGRAIDGAGHGCYQKTWMQAARRRLTHMSSEGGETSMERNPLAPLLTPRRSSRMSPLSVACGGVPFFLLRSSMSMAISSLRVERSRSSRLDWMAMSPPARSAGARAQVRQLIRLSRAAARRVQGCGSRTRLHVAFLICNPVSYKDFSFVHVLEYQDTGRD